MNNYTAMVLIDDTQGGGDNYAFEVTWRATAEVASAPAPFFDDVRACQDSVRQRFSSQNGRGAYLDFDNFADRQSQSNGQGQGRDRNRAVESIEGRGSARSQGESRQIAYSCALDTRAGQVISSSYRYSGASVRPNERGYDRRPLR